jgi:hypothetical protein
MISGIRSAAMAFLSPRTSAHPPPAKSQPLGRSMHARLLLSSSSPQHQDQVCSCICNSASFPKSAIDPTSNQSGIQLSHGSARTHTRASCVLSIASGGTSRSLSFLIGSKGISARGLQTIGVIWDSTWSLLMWGWLWSMAANGGAGLDHFTIRLRFFVRRYCRVITC